MAIAAIPPVGALPAAGAPAAGAPAAPGFADALRNGLEGVSRLEHAADAVTQSVATGGPAQVHDLMIATTKASLGVDLLTQVRNRALEAYQEIMRLPV